MTFGITVRSTGSADPHLGGWPIGVKEMALEIFEQLPNGAIVEMALGYAGALDRKTGQPPRAYLIERWARKAGLSHLKPAFDESLAEYQDGLAALKLAYAAGLLPGQARVDHDPAKMLEAIPLLDNAERLRRAKRRHSSRRRSR